MGIHGLTSFIKQNLTSVSDSLHLAASTVPHSDSILGIVVDGNAFVHYICITALGLAPAFATDYNKLKVALGEWITEFTDSRADLLFVFDGPTEMEKLPTRMSRLKKQSDELAKCESWMCSNHAKYHECFSILRNSHETLRLQSVPPLLALLVIEEELQRLGVKCIRAPGEADTTVSALARSTQAFAVLSNDSDYIIYDTGSAGWIPLWSLDMTHHGLISCVVVLRIRVARLLGITAQDLPYLAALAGHDRSDSTALQLVHQRCTTTPDPCSSSTRIEREQNILAATTEVEKPVFKKRQSTKQRERERARKKKPKMASETVTALEGDGDYALLPASISTTSYAGGLKTLLAAAALLKRTVRTNEGTNSVGAFTRQCSASRVNIVAAASGLSQLHAELLISSGVSAFTADYSTHKLSGAVMSALHFARVLSEELAVCESLYGTSSVDCQEPQRGTQDQNIPLGLGPDMASVYLHRVFVGRTVFTGRDLRRLHSSHGSEVGGGAGPYKCLRGLRKRLYASLLTHSNHLLAACSSVRVREIFWEDGIANTDDLDVSWLACPSTLLGHEPRCCRSSHACDILQHCCSRGASLPVDTDLSFATRGVAVILLQVCDDVQHRLHLLAAFLAMVFAQCVEPAAVHRLHLRADSLPAVGLHVAALWSMVEVAVLHFKYVVEVVSCTRPHSLPTTDIEPQAGVPAADFLDIQLFAHFIRELRGAASLRETLCALRRCFDMIAPTRSDVIVTAIESIYREVRSLAC